jgi:hypothetical protein
MNENNGYTWQIAQLCTHPAAKNGEHNMSIAHPVTLK